MKQGHDPFPRSFSEKFTSTSVNTKNPPAKPTYTSDINASLFIDKV
jgi:hypothetical protein